MKWDVKLQHVEENTCGFRLALLPSHMACVSRIFFLNSGCHNQEEENAPSDHDRRPEMEVTHV